MSRNKEGLEGITLLGNHNTEYVSEYSPDILERFPNRNPTNTQVVNLDCKEFASRCEITNQPDYGTIYISYIPDQWMVA